MESYNEISTFKHDDYKTHIREVILNPLILQHNNVTKEVELFRERVAHLEELSGVGGNLTDILEEIEFLEQNLIANNNSIQSLNILAQGLETLVADNVASVKILEEMVNGLGGTNTDDLLQTVENHLDSIIELQTVVNEHDSTIEVTNTTVQDIVDRVCSTEKTIWYHDNRLKTLESSLSVAGVDGLDLTYLIEKVREIDEVATDNSSSVEALKNVSISVGSEFEKVKNSIDSYAAEVEQLRADVTVYGHKADLIKAGLDEVVQKFFDLHTEFEGTKDLFHSVGDRVDTFDTRLTEVTNEAKLATSVAEGVVKEFADLESQVEPIMTRLDEVIAISNEAVQNAADSASLAEASALKAEEASNKAANVETSVEGLVDKVDTNTASVTDLITRVTDLETKEPEGGPAYDDTEIKQSISDIESNVTAITRDLSDVSSKVNHGVSGNAALSSKVNNAISRIETLEAGGGEGGTPVPPPVSETPTKWYVLPVAGQSNSAGYGYFNIRETMYNPRLVQFKGAEPRVTGTVTSHLTGFGDMHDKMRGEILPGVIPAATCLDHPNAGVNLFQLAMNHGGVDGGASGIGYWLAKRLLNYIPDDYGIMILPCARGSTGFIRRGEQWKVGNILANKLKSDIVNALKMNPENKLFPVVWVQGEDDELDGEAGVGNHNPQLAQDRFLELFTDIKDTLVREKLENRIPSVASYTEGKGLHLGLKPIDYFRWICLSASSYTMFQNRWWEKYDRNYATSDKITHGMHLWNVPSINVWAVYDNYVYLMNTVKNTHDDSHILYSRVDTLPDGKFSLTCFDEMFDKDEGMREAHFGGTTYTQFMPAVVENVMLGYSKSIHGPMPSLYKYTLRGDVPATTDGVLVHFPAKAAGFDLASISKTVSGNSCALGDENFTISLAFKPSVPRRNELIDILQFVGADPLLSQHKGTFIGHRFDDICCKIPMNASITGAWNGGFDSWQHVVFTYNKDFRILNAFLNGKLVGTVDDHDGFSGKTAIRFNNPGESANFRVLSRDISPDEAYALFLKDRA